MLAWDVATVLAVLGAIGAALRWFLGWLDGRATKKHARAIELENLRHSHAKAIEDEKTSLALRIETMQTVFLDALKKIQADADAKLDRHRTEHLADTKLFAQTLAAQGRSKESSAPSSR